MPMMFGPENMRTHVAPAGDGSWNEVPSGRPLMIAPTTLGEAIAVYERTFDVRITPYDGSDPAHPVSDAEPSKYYLYAKDGESNLVDIHVKRNGQEICPKQDLSFALCEADVVEIMGLVC